MLTEKYLGRPIIYIPWLTPNINKTFFVFLFWMHFLHSQSLWISSWNESLEWINMTWEIQHILRKLEESIIKCSKSCRKQIFSDKIFCMKPTRVQSFPSELTYNVIMPTQSRSSLYTEYTSCVEPPKHQGPPSSQREFHFLIWPAAMKTWMIIYCNAVLSPFLCEKQSNHVMWMS